jgi:tRNA G18 (ribose-2'-O)-methylase SpoU
MKSIVLVAHNLRSCHNVGSLLRTADGLGLEAVYLTGYTPYPLMSNDDRLPHEAAKTAAQIHKTALGAEHSVYWQHELDIKKILAKLHLDGYVIAGLEQTTNSVKLPGYKSPVKLALIAGREVSGIEPEVLQACDVLLEIPMFGQKESFNVVQAAAMALYHCRFGGE